MSANRKRHFARKGADPESSDEETEISSSENDKRASASINEEIVTTEPKGQSTQVEESLSEHESESESEFESGSSGSSDNSGPPVQLSRPKFVKKAKSDTSQAPAADTKQSTLELIERTVRAETQLDYTVDDTDGLDPKAEYDAWKKRAEARTQREYDRLAAIEKEYEQRELARENDAKRQKLT